LWRFEEEEEIRERRIILRRHREIAAQERELNRLEIRRKRLEIAILALVAFLLVVSLFPDHIFGSVATMRDHFALDLGAFIQLRD
jgi:uncharacterized membrane protein